MPSDKIDALLNSKSLNDIENRISKFKNCTIYKDDPEILKGLIDKEIETSGLSIDVISEFIERNQDNIVEFGLGVLNKSSPNMLSWGIAITYAIYMILLNRKDNSLKLFINKRRIPNSNLFVSKLEDVGSKMIFR